MFNHAVANPTRLGSRLRALWQRFLFSSFACLPLRACFGLPLGLLLGNFEKKQKGFLKEVSVHPQIGFQNGDLPQLIKSGAEAAHTRPETVGRKTEESKSAHPTRVHPHKNPSNAHHISGAPSTNFLHAPPQRARRRTARGGFGPRDQPWRSCMFLWKEPWHFLLSYSDQGVNFFLFAIEV